MRNCEFEKHETCVYFDHETYECRLYLDWDEITIDDCEDYEEAEDIVNWG